LWYFRKKIEYGRIDGSESRRLHPIVSTKVNFNLTTNDIKGAWHGTHAEKFLMNEVRNYLRVDKLLGYLILLIIQIKHNFE